MSTELLAPVWTHLTEVQPVRAEGVYLYDGDGNRYLDFTSGIGVTNTGHCHPHVVAAIQEQASKLIFGQINVVIPPPVVELAEKLTKVMPAGMDRFFFSNSGAEAVEASVKLARMATGRRNIIVMQGSFHGRTHQAMAMTTSKYVYRHNYQPLPGAVFVSPFPYAYYYGWDEEQTIEFCLKQLDLLLHSQSAPDETAAIVLEPVLGEGGYVPAPDGFLQELRKTCDENGILLILDEIQSGFGRTGKFFAYEHAGITPDIVIMAKGLGSGLPISGIASTAEIMDKWPAGTHGGTYGGGSAIAAAGASATLDVFASEKLVERSAEMGNYLLTRLRAMQSRYPVMGDVRGRGLMIGVEMTDHLGEPDAATTDAVVAGMVQNNVLILSCGSYKNVVRFIPPLVITKEELDEGLAVFEKVLASVVG